MEKLVINYNIPIQGKEDCEEYNRTVKNLFGKDFKPIKTTEDHIDKLV